MMEFFLVRGSVNPVLQMELIEDGRFSYQRSLMNDVLQDSTVLFNMVDEATGLLKVAKGKADIVLAKSDSCEEKYILQYKWNEKDVAKPGVYHGWFEIKFNGNITSDGVDYPTGNLKVPIEEDLRIVIK